MTTDWHRLIDRIDPPLDGETPVRHRTGVVDAVNTDGTINLELSGTVVPDVAALTSVVVGEVVQVLAWRGDLLVLGAARQSDIPTFLISEPIVYTSNGSFVKANYPGLRAVKVRVQAAGGKGGSALATGAGESAAGQSASAGGYAESWVLAGSLAASETVTVPGATTGQSGGNGDNGGNAAFGSHATATGGTGGGGDAAAAGANARAALRGGAASGNLLSLRGGASHAGFRNVNGNRSFSGQGGTARLGRGGAGAANTTLNSSVAGLAGEGHGAGGAGSVNGPSQSGIQGGDGAPGIVTVELLF